MMTSDTALMTPATDKNTIPTTLVCVSDAAESLAAVTFGCLRAARRGHHITLLHVVEPTEFQGLASITDAIRQEREEKAQKMVSDILGTISAQGVIKPAVIMREDSLANGIVSAIEENPNISMVILAVRADSRRGPKLMAALTEALGKIIHVPIMMVPGNLTTQQLEDLS